MARYSEKRQINLIAAASKNADLRGLSIHRVNGTHPKSWPQLVALSNGRAEVYRDGTVIYDTSQSAQSHPYPGPRLAGRFSYTIWDGIRESQALTALVEVNATAPADFVSVRDQKELERAIKSGAPQIFLAAPGTYKFKRNVKQLTGPFTLAGTPSTVVDIDLGGANPGLDILLTGFKVTRQARFAANVRSITRDGVLFYGPSSGVRGSVAYDRMLRATVDLSGLARAPQAGQAIANIDGSAASTITGVYDWSVTTGRATVSINDVPGKSKGGSKKGAVWAPGQGLVIEGRLAGQIVSGLKGGDPLLENAIGRTQKAYPEHDIYRNCEFSGWAQQIGAFGSVSTVIENCSFDGFTNDAIKIFRRDPHPEATVTIRGNRIKGVLVNPEYFRNPHMDAIQIQPEPVKTPVLFTGQILIEGNIMTARGYNPVGDVQGIIVHQHRNANIVIRNNLIDTLRGPRGISAGESTSTCINNTVISSDPGQPNGGVRAGGVDMTGNAGSTFTGCITEVFNGGRMQASLELGRFGGPNNGAYALHLGGPRISDTGDPILDVLRWATPQSAMARNIGAVGPDGRLRG